MVLALAIRWAAAAGQQRFVPWVSDAKVWFSGVLGWLIARCFGYENRKLSRLIYLGSHGHSRRRWREGCLHS